MKPAFPFWKQIEMLISRKRREFGRPARLSDKDAHELWNSSHMECRPYKDATFTKRRMEHDKGTQAIPAVSETAAQTNR